MGNCFITSHLLIEITFGRAPKFVSIAIGSYGSYLVPIALLIELYPMVPFPSRVLEGVSDYSTRGRPHGPTPASGSTVSFVGLEKKSRSLRLDMFPSAKVGWSRSLPGRIPLRLLEKPCFLPMGPGVVLLSGMWRCISHFRFTVSCV